METKQLPESHDEITPALLNRVLADLPGWNDSAIVSVGIHPLESPGGNTYRADLVFENGSSGVVVVKLLDALTPADTGGFFAYDGNRIPW